MFTVPLGFRGLENQKHLLNRKVFFENERYGIDIWELQATARN
jgi:hypothetical protein